MAKHEKKTEGFYDYLTYPREFIAYQWFKPLIIAAILAVFMMLGTLICYNVSLFLTGSREFALSMARGGYDNFNVFTAAGAILILGSMAFNLFGLYVASRIVRDRPFSSYSTSRGGWKWALFFKVFALCLALRGGLTLFGLAFSSNGGSGNQFTVAGAILCIILAPLQCLAEEYLFRGFIAQTVGAWFKIPVLGIIVSSAAFAAMHPYNLYGVLSMFMAGVVFSYLAWKSGGLEASSAMHIVNNAIGFGVAGLGLTKIATEVTIGSVISQTVLQVIVMALVLYIGKKFHWFEPTGDEVTPFNEATRYRLAQKEQ